MTPLTPSEDQRQAIQTAAARSGLTTDVIRIWELRYHAVAPSRSADGQRWYSEIDIQRLILMRRAVERGQQIDDLASMENAQLERLFGDGHTAEDLGGCAEVHTVVDEHLDNCLLALGALDARRMQASLNLAAQELSVAGLIDDLLMPLATLIGDSWGVGSVDVVHEHFATQQIRALLDGLRHQRHNPVSAPEIVVATPSGEQHELGALSAAVIASSCDWSVCYLGVDVPRDGILHAVSSRRPRALAISCIHADLDGGASRLEALFAELPPELEVFVGGAAMTPYRSVLDRFPNAQMPGSFQEFGEQLRAVSAKRGPTLLGSR